MVRPVAVVHSGNTLRGPGKTHHRHTEVPVWDMVVDQVMAHRGASWPRSYWVSSPPIDKTMFGLTSKASVGFVAGGSPGLWASLAPSPRACASTTTTISTVGSLRKASTEQ
jgi:hypothetical protein